MWDLNIKWRLTVCLTGGSVCVCVCGCVCLEFGNITNRKTELKLFSKIEISAPPLTHWSKHKNQDGSHLWEGRGEVNYPKYLICLYNDSKWWDNWYLEIIGPFQWNKRYPRNCSINISCVIFIEANENNKHCFDAMRVWCVAISITVTVTTTTNWTIRQRFSD